MDYYKRAIGVAPTAATAHHNLGVLMAERGELETAVACYGREGSQPCLTAANCV